MNMETYKFDSLVNFRRLQGTKLFRSAKPDNVSKQEVDTFLKLDIKRILDFRNMKHVEGYANSTGEKLLDDIYQPYELEPPTKTSPGVKFYKLHKNGEKQTPKIMISSLNNVPKAHILFNLAGSYFEKLVFDYPFYIKILCAFLYILDKLLGKSLFLKFIVWYSFNPVGLCGTFKDIIEYSGENICLALKFLSEPENVPALINCSFGKDRTGIMSALILGLLGADKHTIATDFAVTQEFYDLYIGDLVILFKLVHLNKSFGDAKYETMIELLEYIDGRYGSLPGYLKKIGFDEKDQEKLIKNIKL